MNTERLLRIGAVLIGTTLLVGCTGAPHWGNWSQHPTAEQLDAASSGQPIPEKSTSGGDSPSATDGL